MRYTTVIALVVIAGVFVVSACLFNTGGDSDSPMQLPQDPLSAEAETLPPGKVKILLTRRPAPNQPPTNEQSFEWAILASLRPQEVPELPPDRQRECAGTVGWVVIRRTLSVIALPVTDRPDMMRLQHRADHSFIRCLPGVPEATTGGAVGCGVVPTGSMAYVAVFSHELLDRDHWTHATPDAINTKAPPNPRGTWDDNNPDSYSILVPKAALATAITPLQVHPTVVDLPATVELLRMGTHTTTLFVRP